MLIRLLTYQLKKKGLIDYDLVTILRALSVYGSDVVLDHIWRVSDLDIYLYKGGSMGPLALSEMFSDSQVDQSNNFILVLGQQLIEKSSLVHQTEGGLFVRLVDPSKPVEIDADYRLCRGPSSFQGTNIDLEIRSNESPFEIVSNDLDLIEHLEYTFVDTEIEH